MKETSKNKLKEFIISRTNHSYSTRELSDMFNIGIKTCRKYLNKFLIDSSMSQFIKTRTMGYSDLWIFNFPKEYKIIKTMNEEYGDGSDHEVCEDCGYCKTCGDCKEFGCKGKINES